MSNATITLLTSLAALASWYIWRWFAIEHKRTALRPRTSQPGFGDLAIGFITNFFDTLGIGSFAPTTALFKFRRRIRDEDIPGTLNVGHALPTLAEALIFIAAVDVERWTLIGMIAAAVLGAWIGVGVVARLPRRAIQLGMGSALLIAALLFVAKNLNWMPSGGDALGLEGVQLGLAVAVSFVLGALMMIGVGLYAPCLVLVSLLGMNPLAAFPIMMGSCAFLMPVGGVRFVQAGRYDLRGALGLAIGGIPGVLVAAFLVKSLPIEWIRWVVVVVVTFAGIQMLISSLRTAAAGTAEAAKGRPPAVS